MEENTKNEQKKKQELRAERKPSQQSRNTAQKEKKRVEPTKDRSDKNESCDNVSREENAKHVIEKKEPTLAEKAQLKAERRKVQEMQREAKLAKKKQIEMIKTGCPSLVVATKRVPDNIKVDDANVRKKMAKKLASQNLPQRRQVDRKLHLFSHLTQYEREPSIMGSLKLKQSSSIHPAILHLGLQYSRGVVSGSNARSVALLRAFQKVIEDYVTPPQKELSRDLEAKIKPYISFLNECRPLAVSMGNVIKFLKQKIAMIQSHTSDSEARESLVGDLEQYVTSNLTSARELIAQDASKKIVDGDVILTYACSSLIKAIVLKAHQEEKKFKVIVVDGRPKMEGKEFLRFLVRNEVECSYVLINAVSYAMHEATKVMLGAHSLQANGYVMSRVGSSQIALVANSRNVPVLVCCETYKFCERTQADSFVFNELGDPNDLVCEDKVGMKDKSLKNWKEAENLYILNLSYDVTPPSFVSAVITEKGTLPCTSVPAILRVRQSASYE